MNTTIIIFSFFIIFFKNIYSAAIPGAPVIRVNQAGYSSDDNYKTAVVSGISGEFRIYSFDNLQTPLYTKQLTLLGSDSVTGETLYLADFSDFNTEGKFVIKVGNEVSYPFEIRNDLYNKVLYYVLRVYGANRCGPYDSWIHGHCHTKDGVIRGQNKSGTLVGGWHDCGDHVKFGHTMFYAACALLFAYNNWPDRFGDVYGFSYDGTYYSPRPDGIPDVLNEVKVVTDYLLNLYNASVEDGLISQNKLYYQVGDGDDDHTWWHKPEYQDDFPQSRGGQPREVWSDIGADLAGRFSAALAMMATAYYKFDREYSQKCLEAAKVVYNIGKNVYGITGRNTGGKGYYQPDTRADDDMALAALELYKATLDNFYLQETQYWMAKEQKWQFCSYYVLSYPNVFAFVLYDYYPYASTVDNSPSEFDTKIVTKDECIEWLERDVLQSAPAADIYGRKWNYGWGTCRYMMGVAATAVMAYDLSLKKGNPNSQMLKIAKDQMNWIFGRNQFGMSFVIGNKQDGWLTKYPQHPHHRAANPDGENVPELPTYQATELTGATIGGPKSHTDFSDYWEDYQATETGVDYWAGTLITAAYFAKPVNLVTDAKPNVSLNLINGTTLQGLVSIQVTATDDKEIKKIELFINSVLVSTAASSPLIYLWNTVSIPDGVYQIKAKAFDSISQTTEKDVVVYVRNTEPDVPPTDNPPTITFNLLEGTTISATVNIVVTVTDDVSVSTVAFYINDTLINTYQGSFNYQLDTLSYPNGKIVLKVTAIDSSGQQTTRQITVFVYNIPGDTPPNVTIHQPLNNQIVSGIITISATASDDNLVSRMELYFNNILLSSVTLNNLVYVLDTRIYNNDTYMIKVVAYDNSGQTSFSEVRIYIYNEILQNQNNDNPQNEQKNILEKHQFLLSHSNYSNSQINLNDYYQEIYKVEVFDPKGSKIKEFYEPPFVLNINDKIPVGFYILKITQNNNSVIFASLSVLK